MLRVQQSVRFLILLVSLVFSIMAPGPLLGHAAPFQRPMQQDGIPIRYGETLSGTITESVPCQYYRFEGTQGDLVTVDMTRTSGTLDGVMALYWQDDLSQAPLINNDDRPGGGLDPLIAFSLPETSWYTVAACRLQADRMRVTTGDYTLTLIGPDGETAVPDTTTSPETAAAPASADSSAASATEATSLPSLSNSLFGGGATATPAPAVASGTLSGDLESLADGSRIEGELVENAESVTYSLPVVAGDVVTLDWTRTQGDFAPQLRITDENWRVLALASSPDAVSALVLVLRVPEDGTLTISVARHGATPDDPAMDGSTGAFTLEVEVMSLMYFGAQPKPPSQPD